MQTENRMNYLKGNTLKSGRKSWREQWSAEAYKRHASNGGTWQKELERYQSADSRAYYCDAIPRGLRQCGDASDILNGRNQAKGYYTDNFGDGFYFGFVLQLPARERTPQYIAGVQHNDWDGVTLYPLDASDNVEDAARTADHHAERLAEEAREFDAKEQAEQQKVDARETIEDSRASRRSIVAAMRQARTTSVDTPRVLCDVLRKELATLKQTSREAYKRIEALTDNYWSSVS
jgi:hypothetical protein